MADQPLVTDEIKAWIGRQGQPRTEVVEAGLIKRWARAVFDDTPLHTDEDYAKRSRYDALVAPPTFCLGVAREEMGHNDEQLLRPPIKAARSLAGGDEWEFFQPIKAGDVITRRVRLADVYEKQGSRGSMAFLVFETDYTNQRGELAVRMRRTSILL